jgi:hypothetical protein
MGPSHVKEGGRAWPAEEGVRKLVAIVQERIPKRFGLDPMRPGG